INRSASRNTLSICNGQSDVFWRRFAETLESELSLVERTGFSRRVWFLHVTGSVTLAWDPTPSPCVTEFGYNLYRGEKPGSYSAQPVNKQLLKGPTYTDASVLAGKTYYYVVKTKCGNAESEPSNEIKVDVHYKLRKEKMTTQ